MMLRGAAGFLGLTLFAGCSEPADGTADTDTNTTSETSGPGSTGGETSGAAAVYYHDDVLPLFMESCAGCHTEGGVAPFVIDDYETAAMWGPAIRAAVESRTMPPYNADNSGVCNTFKDARWLSDAEIQLIADWVEGGRLEGDASIPTPPRPAPDELTGATIEQVDTPVYVPKAAGNAMAKFDDYRCFPLEVGNGDAPRFLTGFEVLPGNAAVVHHAVGFKVDPNQGQNSVVMTLLDNQDPEPGWQCFGAAGDSVQVDGSPITWAPGAGARNFPEGTGIRFEPGEIIVLQMHYNLLNGDGSDTTGLRLSWADEVEREAWSALNDKFLFAGLSGTGLALEPGHKSVVWGWETRINEMISHDGPVDVMAFLPHMHERGQRMQVKMTIDGQEHCGIYVDRWDFNWQDSFFLERPFQMRPWDKLEVTCEWNTEGENNPVEPGFGTGNEMCLIGLYAAEAAESRD